MRPAPVFVALILAIAGFGVQSASAATMSSNPKIVLIVGATESVTPSYRSDMDAVAATAAKYSTNIVKVYSPNATWAAVRSALQGANIVVYMGHGNGFPSPYNSILMPDRVDGFGLNATAGKGDSNNTYYGESAVSGQVRLAPHALVILSHLCYASGDSEPGNPQPSLAVAQRRIDNFAAGFRQAGASTVIADGHNNPSYYLDALFSTHQTMEQLWRADPWTAGHVFAFTSDRTPGDTALADPDTLTGNVYTNFYRSIVVAPGTTTDDVLGGVQETVTPPSAATYHALSPTRLLDTRSGNGLSGAFASHVGRGFQVTGRGGVPSGASAVTGNLTVTGQTAAGYLYVGPSATDNPTSSTLNFPIADTRANGVTVALGAAGTLSVTYVASNLGPTAHVIFDVTGYFTPDATGSTYHALSPTRLLDTRSGNGLSGAFASHVGRGFQVTGRGGVPSGASAVTGNLTVTGQTAAGYLYVGPSATDNPTSSTLNFPIADTRANGVTVALGAAGTLSVTYVASNLGPTAHVIFDVTGYFTPDATGSTYHALSPTRLLDTRSGNGLSGAFASHVGRGFQVTGRGGVPSGASAVTGNLTVTGQTAAGYLYVGPSATDNPTSSTLNFPIADTRANGVTVALGAAGTLSVTYVASNLGPTAHVIFDVTGYFTP